ncbi:MAG: OmpW family outer membrane protein [Ignavibacteriaceae bacterium]
MKAVKLKSIIIISLLLSVNLFAQDLLTGLTYSISVPTGNTSEYISKTSFKGLSIDLRKFFSYNASIGFLVGWSAFEEETNKTISTIRRDVSAEQSRLINAFPVMITTHYYIGEGREFRPFIGIGVGMYYFYHQLELADDNLESNKWHFGAAPEAGFVYLLESIYSFANVRYNYAFSAENEFTKVSTSQSYLTFNIGFAFTPLTYF